MPESAVRGNCWPNYHQPLSHLTEGKDIIVGDVGQHQMILARFYNFKPSTVGLPQAVPEPWGVPCPWPSA
jgi:thiamine pyrophosphate-dependent acetolactate synthase large subunit-like protein